MCDGSHKRRPLNCYNTETTIFYTHDSTRHLLTRFLHRRLHSIFLQYSFLHTFFKHLILPIFIYFPLLLALLALLRLSLLLSLLLLPSSLQSFFLLFLKSSTHDFYFSLTAAFKSLIYIAMLIHPSLTFLHLHSRRLHKPNLHRNSTN